MKILILSCNTGGGHNSAALAVQEALHERGAWAEIVDPLSFAGDAAKEAASNLYNSIIRNVPKAFGVIYRVGELADSALPKSPVYMANALYADKLLAYIRRENIDAVVSTHLYGMEAMTAIRKKLGERVPNYGVLTDYTCIPFFSDTQLDGYFIPHRDLRGELAAKGIDEKLMYDTGIPVSARFSQRLGQSEARERLDLPRRGAVYLVMTGEVGCGRADELCDELIARETGDFTA
ncbi:MAG: glycosyl transferase, partial [Clostridiales bacterium]|nr:glycosyl transferase [Clostridiales bacterium]